MIAFHDFDQISKQSLLFQRSNNNNKRRKSLFVNFPADPKFYSNFNKTIDQKFKNKPNFQALPMQNAWRFAPISQCHLADSLR